MSTARRIVAPEWEDEDLYPAEDGEPMAETQIHIRAIILLFQAFEDFLIRQLDIYIAANMFWYWEKGNPGARRAPDVMIIKGVGRAERRSFFTWRENGAVPSVIVEVVSKKKYRDDYFTKRELYAKLGVKEYFLFDPEAIHFRPPLVGFRRNERGRYVRIKPDSDKRLRCDELGLLLQSEGKTLRLIDAATGQSVLSRDERAEGERQRAEALQAEVARLKALLKKTEISNGGGVAPS
jgi:Uma2 family endonuclease